MATLRLKPRPPVEDEVENWDDDDFMIDNNDDLSRWSTSSHAAQNPSSRRDSRSSLRSDRESLPGQEERHVHLPAADEKSTLDAIAAATHAGIPIPTNVPPSALMGGTIKRLGGRKIKKIFQEDWGDDMELPESGHALRIKPQDGSQFPEAIRQVSGSSVSPSPAKALQPLVIPAPVQNPNKPALGAPINLENFRDADEDNDDVFGSGIATLKPPKVRSQQRPVSLITPPTPHKKEDDDFEMDLELPNDGQLRLSRRKDIPKAPSLPPSDDFDWGEGSLGTRFGGTRRDAFSNRSSSVSAMSPSIASSLTAESEDENLDGLELPLGPLDLGERLKRRKLSRSPERRISDNHQSSPAPALAQGPASDQEDFLSGLEVGEGEMFGSSKATLHRNVKVKEARPASPVRPKTAVSITFTNKPTTSPPSRLPRPMAGHERSHTQPSLEPVSESGGPIVSRTIRRTQSRVSHSAQSSVSSVQGPSTPSPAPHPSTPRRRELGNKNSTGALRTEPSATTSAQLLRLKRSLPAMRPGQSPAKPPVSRPDRPPSRTESGRPLSLLRPKTPVDRSRPGPAYEGSAAQARRNLAPSGSGGPAQPQSLNSRNSRTFKRNEADQGPDLRPLSRTFSRSAMRSPSPRRQQKEKMSAEPVWQQVNKPRRLRQFGDGHELDAFDDLPTSAQTESRYTKQASGSGNRTNIRNKIYQNVLPDRGSPSPVSPHSPARADQLPHFARDTTSSRLAREASLAQRAPQSGPLTPLTTQRVAQLSTRTQNPNLSQNSIRQKKTRKPPQQKPHLITNLTASKESKIVNGMTYNPVTYRWEGNENALNLFNPPVQSPSTTALPQHMARDREGSTPGPVLIKDMGSSKGTKRIGDMVFDPQNMCWLKVDAGTPTPNSHDPMESLNVLDDDDDDDPFKDIPDLEDKEMDSKEGGRGRVSDIKDEWLVGEEFDVGPEFIRRQHEEEERWRKKCEKWVGAAHRDRETWRWAIRNIVNGA